LISKDILKLAIEKKERENFRFWLILRQARKDKSGHFRLSDLPRYLHGYYKFSDHSNNKRFIQAKYNQFNKSIFFRHLKGDLFQVVGEKRLLIDHTGNATTHKYKIPAQVLKSKRDFLDYCIGVFLSNSTYSNNKVADIFKVTPRRIQQATHRNDKTALIVKEHRNVLTYTETLADAYSLNQTLSDVYQIKGTKILTISGQFYVSLNTTNKYHFQDVIRKKGTARKGTLVKREKPEQYFKSMFKKTASGKYYRERFGNLLYFNDPVYSFQDYLNEHGCL